MKEHKHQCKMQDVEQNDDHIFAIPGVECRIRISHLQPLQQLAATCSRLRAKCAIDCVLCDLYDIERG
jgi:hypothetical protein